MEFTIHQIAGLLGGEVKGNGGDKINMLAKIQDAKTGQIAFLSNPKYEQFIYTTQASAVIVKNNSITAGSKWEPERVWMCWRTRSAGQAAR